MNSNQVVLSNIESKIYLIRGEKVMLDQDLAELYDVPTMRLNEQVKRNLRRFPPDFMFQLSDQEFRILISQFAISSSGWRAIDVNVAIMRTFVRLRQVLSSNPEFENRLTELESKFDGHFEVVFKAIEELMSERSIPLVRVIGLSRT